MLLTPRRSVAPAPSRLWLLLALILVLGWMAQHWPRQTLPPPRTSDPPLILRDPAPAAPSALSWRAPNNLGALIQLARQQPAIGSHYHALRALDFCSRQARFLLDDAGLAWGQFSDTRQIVALMQIQALCAPEEGRPAPDYFTLAEEGVERNDPLLALAMRLERLSVAPHESPDLNDASRRADLLQRIFATEDPALLGDLASELGLLGSRLRFEVAGVAVEADAQADLLAALQDMACGRVGCHDDKALLLRCAAAGQCDLPQPDAPSWQRMRFLALLQISGGRALDFSYQPRG